MCSDGWCRLVHEERVGLGIRSGELALGGAEADVRTAVLKAALLAEHGVVSLGVRSEAPKHREDTTQAQRKHQHCDARNAEERR